MQCFDSSFFVPALITGATSPAVVSFFAGLPDGDLAISRWVRVEFAAILARDVRLGAIAAQQAVDWGSTFEAVVPRSFSVLLPTSVDFDVARVLVGDAKRGLRGPDALHSAIAKIDGATVFYSLDTKLVGAARSRGLTVISGVFRPDYPAAAEV